MINEHLFESVKYRKTQREIDTGNKNLLNKIADLNKNYKKYNHKQIESTRFHKPSLNLDKRISTVKKIGHLQLRTIAVSNQDSRNLAKYQK